MILRQLLKAQQLLLPRITSTIQSRGIRPIIKISNEKFEISIDVKQFDKDELIVKARPEYVVIQGKQERKTETGYIMRQFIRKFRLPSGCDPENMKSELSADGILTVTAHRLSCGINLPCEQNVPIALSGVKKDLDYSYVVVEESSKERRNPCDRFALVPKDKQFTIKGDDTNNKAEKK